MVTTAGYDLLKSMPEERKMLNSGAAQRHSRFASKHPVRSLLLFLSIFLVSFPFTPTVQAGPPFQTDDPDPVPLHHYEAYLFGTADRGSGATNWGFPAVEFNIGAAPNLQLHVTIPGGYVNPGGAFGIGDIEVGVKYRLMQESKKRPEAGIFPLLELPTGNSRMGLGNGQLWARLPLWAQKSFGLWTTYGGAGYQINRAPGMKDSMFAGWLVQRQISKRLVLGVETYHQEAQAIEARQTTFVDSGGYYNFSDQLSLLFMLGRTVTGERHTIGYLGLYYTWGGRRSSSPSEQVSRMARQL
jgi:hypothetical protein